MEEARKYSPVSSKIEEEVRALPPESLGLEASFSWEALPGDASNRSYARIQSGSEARIVMILNEKEAFKSEEAAASSSPQETLGDIDFVKIGRDWRSQGIPVPRIDYIDPAYRFLILEDFGQRLLYDERDKPHRLSFYKKAMEVLVRIQNLKPNERIQARAFNEALLSWEFEHFLEYAIEKRGGPKALQKFEAWMRDKIQFLAKMPAVVTHRDFHSKNLMILGDESLGVIDFQDALMGPSCYDLASLLRDSYVRLSPEEEETLLSEYERLSGQALHREAYAWMSLQRNLKAIGRFFYISMVKKKDTHLPFVEPSVKRVIQTLESLSETGLAEEMRKEFLENSGG